MIRVLDTEDADGRVTIEGQAALRERHEEMFAQRPTRRPSTAWPLAPGSRIVIGLRDPD
jgi:hypothetical protein